MNYFDLVSSVFTWFGRPLVKTEDFYPSTSLLFMESAFEDWYLEICRIVKQRLSLKLILTIKDKILELSFNFSISFTLWQITNWFISFRCQINCQMPSDDCILTPIEWNIMKNSTELVIFIHLHFQPYLEEWWVVP